MHRSFTDFAAVPLVLAAAKWFQPPAVLAILLTLTLVVTLRRVEKLTSRRQLWVVLTLVGSGLTMAIAFLGALTWLVRIGVM